MSVHDQGDDPELHALLGTLREDVADEGFDGRLHQRLAAAGAPREPSAATALLGWLRERPWLLGATAGAVSGVAAFALSAALAEGELGAGRPGARAVAAGDSAKLGLACPEPAAQPVGAVAGAQQATPVGIEASAEVFVVPVGKVAMVQLNFAVDRDVELAEFSVLLPEGLAFFSEGQALPEHAFHWEAPLARGDNAVPIAVLGERPGRHRLAATATIAGEVVVHEIVLDVKEAT